MKKSFKQMVGKDYIYREEVYNIFGVRYEDGEYIVDTDKKTLNVKEVELEEDFREAPNMDMVRINESIQNEMTESRELSTILRDTIKQVQANAGYVNQAKAINDSIKNLIDMKKTQIDMVRLLKN